MATAVWRKTAGMRCAVWKSLLSSTRWMSAVPPLGALQSTQDLPQCASTSGHYLMAVKRYSLYDEKFIHISILNFLVGRISRVTTKPCCPALNIPKPRISGSNINCFHSEKINHVANFCLLSELILNG